MKFATVAEAALAAATAELAHVATLAETHVATLAATLADAEALAADRLHELACSRSCSADARRAPADVLLQLLAADAKSAAATAVADAKQRSLQFEMRRGPT